MIPVLLLLFCVSGVQGYVNVSISALPYLIMTRKFDILMDVRTPEEYYEGHVPTAVLVPVLNITDILETGAYSEYTNLTVGVTCRTGRRSTIASEIMENDYGFSDLINIVGGWRDWSSNCSALPYENGNGECVLCGEDELA